MVNPINNCGKGKLLSLLNDTLGCWTGNQVTYFYFFTSCSFLFPSPPSPATAPGLVGLGDSDVEMAAGSLPSVHPLCLFPFGCWVLFIGHIPPEYETDWDLRPFAAMLVHGHMSPPATKCKEICACALGANSRQRYKETKK